MEEIVAEAKRCGFVFPLSEMTAAIRRVNVRPRHPEGHRHVAHTDSTVFDRFEYRRQP